MKNASPPIEKNPPTAPLSSQRSGTELFSNDPLLSAIEIAKELWADEHADEYVERLRKDW